MPDIHEMIAATSDDIPLVLDQDRRKIIGPSGATVALTSTESRTLAVLARSSRVVSHDSLIAALWAEDEPECSASAIKVLVCRIRAKIAAAGWSPLISTEWGSGYALCRPVTIVSAAPAPVCIPFDLKDCLERLLYSHPDRAAADRVLAAVSTT